MDVRFIDTTLRDGSQSLWALGMRVGMIEAVAEAIDRAGFDAVEVPVTGIFVKKFVRDLKENPWDMSRMIGRKMPNTVKTCMSGAFFAPFEAPPPRVILELFFKRLVETGAFNRAQLTSNTLGQIKRAFPWIVPFMKSLGLEISFALSYTISPRHTDEYYAQTTRELLQFKPDTIYLKDQGGLLTLDRLRTLLPLIIENAGGVPVEVHSHCTTGLAPLVYLEALKLGVRVLHTAIPPLANGSSQPSVFNVAQNARLMGFTPQIDEAVLRPVSERFTAIAKQENLAIGAPLEYDYAQYIHQVPGGVISNLKYQLAGMGMLDRLNDVLDEAVRVRREMGYPIMITPHSQFVVSQSALNVTTGERYKLVTDELILFAQGVYSEDSGYTFMDQNLKDRLLDSQRAKELAQLAVRQKREFTLEELRASLGGAGVSDEEFLLRFIMKGTQEIEAMHGAGPYKSYFSSTLPLPTLLQELGRHQRVRYIHVQRGDDALVLQNRSAA